MGTPTSFNTMRLHARRLCEQDFADIRRMDQNEQVRATLGGVISAELSCEWMARNLAHWDGCGFGIYMLREADGQLVGRAGLRPCTVEGEREVELGYALMPTFWRQGLATEISSRLVQIGFQDLKLTKIVSFTLPMNVASQGVMQKVGFKYVRDIVHAGLPHVLYELHAPAANG